MLSETKPTDDEIGEQRGVHARWIGDLHCSERPSKFPYASHTRRAQAVRHSMKKENRIHLAIAGQAVRLAEHVDRNLTILIAEDNEDYALILQHAIKANGWANPVRILPNGGEVIRYLSGEGEYADRASCPFPSVMFLDVKMPSTTGFDVLQWARGRPDCSVLPTMMLTSSEDEKDVRLAFELGANAYFVKPATLNELKEMLQTIYAFWTWSSKPGLPAARFSTS
jgi:CheY-like chemotaxis protein